MFKWIDLQNFADARGNLKVIEFSSLPFMPLRAFIITDVPAGVQRGGHAHRVGDQILIALAGLIRVDLRHDGEHRSVVCEPKGRGLLIPQRVWAKQTYLVSGSELMVLCSHEFDPENYIIESETSSNDFVEHKSTMSP